MLSYRLQHSTYLIWYLERCSLQPYVEFISVVDMHEQSIYTREMINSQTVTT